MKKTVLLSMLCIGAALISCRKSGVTPTLVSSNSNKTNNTGNVGYTIDGSPFTGDIQGSWRIVSDSIWTGAGLMDTLISKSYAGTASDYYKFAANGTLYVKEAASLDTAAYLQDKNILKLTYTFVNNQNVSNNPYQLSLWVNQLNSNSIVIYKSLASPGGIFNQKITLITQSGL
jgi:hypothetical protein